MQDKCKDGVVEAVYASNSVLGTEIEENPLVSVILPAYNEAKIIGETVTAFYEEICHDLPAEIIVAEDGSTDGTREILSSLKDDLPIVLLSSRERKGFAKALSDALRSCRGDWIFFSDSDGQYFPSDFWDLWEKRDGYDMVIGRKLHRSEAPHRTILAIGFHKIINALFGLDLHDADSGFRLIRKDVISSVLDRVEFLKYSFSAELTIRASLKGFRINEVPINHRGRKHGDTQIFKLYRVPMIVLKQLMGLIHLYVDALKNP